MPGVTSYLNTDLVLASRHSLADLCEEFDRTCCVLYQQQGDGGDWHVAIESNAIDNVSATDDIRQMMAARETLSSRAVSQWNACHERCFNIGFDCGETWAYQHSLPQNVLGLIADAGCSLTVTLYPIRDVEP